MNSKAVFWGALGLYGVTTLIHNGTQLVTTRGGVANWVSVAGALLILVGVAGTIYRPDTTWESQMSAFVYYITTIGALLAVGSIIWRYL